MDGVVVCSLILPKQETEIEIVFFRFEIEKS